MHLLVLLLLSSFSFATPLQRLGAAVEGSREEQPWERRKKKGTRERNERGGSSSGGQEEGGVWGSGGVMVGPLKAFSLFFLFFLFLGVTAVEQKAELAMPVLVSCDGETPLAFSVQGDEGLVDCEATPRAQQYGAQRDFSAWGAKYWRMIMYHMKLLFSKSVCKGISKL